MHASPPPPIRNLPSAFTALFAAIAILIGAFFYGTHLERQNIRLVTLELAHEQDPTLEHSKTIERVERIKNSMRADQVAQLAVSLASPACKDVNGQIFAARGNEIFLMSQPRPVRGMGKIEGWTPSTIAEHCMAAMRPSFTDLAPTTGTFGWDPV